MNGELLNRAVSLLEVLEEADRDFADALNFERTARQRWQEAAEMLKGREADVVLAAAAEATEKRGPLAGVAKTSKEYDYALTALLNNARVNGLGVLWEDVNRLKIDLAEAEAGRERSAAHLSAVKHASDLMAAILQATT